MTKHQLIVLHWWHSGRNFEKGVALFNQLGKNQILKLTLSRKKNPAVVRKLEYELTKCVGLDWKNMPGIPEGGFPAGAGLDDADKSVAGEPGSVESDSAGSEQKYPPVIRKIINERSELYNKRSVLHAQMADVPVNNTPQNNAERKQLLSAIQVLSGRLDMLYPFVRDFEQKGIVPDPFDVWPETRPEPEASLEDLLKQKKNLQTANTRDRNLLSYQQHTKLNKKKPMPEGPKRTEVENRIEQRHAEIAGLNVQINKLKANAG